VDEGGCVDHFGNHRYFPLRRQKTTGTKRILNKVHFYNLAGAERRTNSENNLKGQRKQNLNDFGIVDSFNSFPVVPKL
jgi:hypothetical protein